MSMVQYKLILTMGNRDSFLLKYILETVRGKNVTNSIC
jgi:hypothetical protein